MHLLLLPWWGLSYKPQETRPQLSLWWSPTHFENIFYTAFTPPRFPHCALLPILLCLPAHCPARRDLVSRVAVDPLLQAPSHTSVKNKRQVKKRTRGRAKGISFSFLSSSMYQKQNKTIIPLLSLPASTGFSGQASLCISWWSGSQTNSHKKPQTSFSVSAAKNVLKVKQWSYVVCDCTTNSFYQKITRLISIIWSALHLATLYKWVCSFIQIYSLYLNLISATFCLHMNIIVHQR